MQEVKVLKLLLCLFQGCRETRGKEKNSRELSESKVRNVQVRKRLVTEDIGEDCEDTEQVQGKKSKTTEKDNTSQVLVICLLPSHLISSIIQCS